MMVSGMNSEGVFFIYNYVVDNVLLENGGYLDINVYGSVNKTIIKDKGIMLVLINVKVDVIWIDNGGVMDVVGNVINIIINGGI